MEIMGVARPIKVAGRIFPSIKDAAKNYRIASQTVVGRLRDGWSPAQAVSIAAKPKRTAHNGIAVRIDGKRYASLETAALAFGIEPKTARARLYYGYSIEDAFKGNLRKRVSARAKPIVYQRKKYSSRSALAEAYGITPGLLMRRMKVGWTVAQAVEDEAPPPRFRNFEGHAREVKWKNARPAPTGVEPIPDAGGYKLYLLVNSVNRKVYVGITVGSLDDRLRSHFGAARRGRKQPLSNAIRKHGEKSFKIKLIRNDARSHAELMQQEVDEISHRNSIKKGYNVAVGGALGTAKTFTVQGRTFLSRSHAAEYYDIPVGKLNVRLNHGWSPEEAVGLVDRNWVSKPKPIVVHGKRYASIRAAAVALGLDSQKVTSRFSDRGWTLEQALELVPPPETTRYLGRAVIVFGIEYPSIAQAAQALGVAPEPFRLRLLEGISPEEAYERARKKREPLQVSKTRRAAHNTTGRRSLSAINREPG